MHPPARRGDVVAIRRGGFLRVKRLVGLPGDTIGFHEGRLSVNGEVFYSDTRIPVDQDTLRRESRWTGRAELQRDHDRAWRLAKPPQVNTPFAWLTYHHRAVHSNDAAAPIRDDYPGNVNVVRELKPVHDLVLTLNAGPIDDRTAIGDIDALFWSPEGVRLQTRAVRDEFTTLEFSSRLAIPCEHTGTVAEPLAGVVSESSPVSIRIGRDMVCSGLLLERLVLYRLNPDHDASAYPLQLGDDQVFVLGDNVPVSVDSRDWGPIRISSMVGVIQG